MWKNTDPRFDIYKRANIIIARPGLNSLLRVGSGFVDTKDGWYIHTSFEDYKSIDEWNEDWYWTIAPDIKGKK
jgi:hypothetical protein